MILILTHDQYRMGGLADPAVDGALRRVVATLLGEDDEPAGRRVGSGKRYRATGLQRKRIVPLPSMSESPPSGLSISL